MKIYISLVLLLLIQYGSATIPNSGNLMQSGFESESMDEESPELSKFSCTIFTVEHNGTTYFGGNEDEGGLRKNTEVRFIPGKEGTRYGCALFGFVDNELGGNDVDGIGISGINEKGLCFDANGISPGYATSDIDGQCFASLGYWEFILKECASVSEVINWHNTHNMGGWWFNQVHWADSTGAAVVIGPNGTVVFTEKREDDSLLVSTNFNLANPLAGDYPCWRYATVTNSLNIYLRLNDITVDNLKLTLKSVHAPGTSVSIGTAYTHIFNLNTCEIYIYILGNYDEVLHFNLADELTKDWHSYRLTDDLIGSLEESMASSNASPGLNLLPILLWLIPIVYWRKKKKPNN